MRTTTRECYNCNQDIYFDDKQRSSTGKLIPLDVDTGQRHECKRTKDFIGDIVMDLHKKESGY